MPFEMWIAFVLAAGANILAPGPAIVLALQNGMTRGAKPAVFSSLGNITAIGVVGLLVALGLGTVISDSEAVLAMMRLGGGGYLLWMGLRAFRRGLLRFDGLQSCARRGDRPHRLYGQAMMVGLTNPKMILFLTALFPMFLSRDYPAMQQFAIMTVSFMALSFTILMTIALTASRLSVIIADARAQRCINHAVALVFSGFGSWMIGVGSLGIMRILQGPEPYFPVF